MLRMVVAAANPSANGGSNDHLGRILAAGAIPILRELVHHLVVRRPDEIRELNLRYRNEPVERHPDRASDDASLAERRVDDTIFSEFVEQPLRDTKDSADLPDVLTENDDAIIATHLDAQRVVDRLD